MKYVFLEFIEDRGYDASIKAKTKTRNYPLENLFEFLRDKQSRWIKATEDDEDSRKIIIWSEWSFKDEIDTRNFKTNEDLLAYSRAYQTYSRKRWKEMPCIKIFKENLEFLEHQWQEIRKKRPKYLIFRQHDNGFVDILEKDELSAEDKAIIEREHKIYLNYIKRWEAYLAAHPERSRVWRSPADDEYESDFALYDPADEQNID